MRIGACGTSIEVGRANSGAEDWDANPAGAEQGVDILEAKAAAGFNGKLCLDEEAAPQSGSVY